ncbi:hypothetical protein SSX86_014180 [Deinandra increscens subsp. villosa]|uniref:Zinc finger CCCH domain-containing protein 44 n=1 Tax=Deinandra increscens subsp. villosa TaxID=3103831 RepID=A0AAP0D6P7_9ASTR
MEAVRNSGAESQSSDQSQPIQEVQGEAGSKTGGDPAEGMEVELRNGGGGGEMVKKKRGRPPRAQAKSPPVKTSAKMVKEEDEDVCFICFDGGSLVLCDRRGCPKAYHPACVKRDEAFFRSKAKWNCGWHICSVCQKAAHHMCYTCTYSLCKGCLKKTDYLCVRGDKGFCTVCMKTIMLIENGGQEKDEKAQVDFDDKTSWEYLFKVYWIYLKGKLSLTLDELTQAKNSGKEASATALVVPSIRVDNGDSDLKNISSDMSQNLGDVESKRRKTDEQISIVPHKETVITQAKNPGEEASATDSVIPSIGVDNGDNDLKNISSDMSQNLGACTEERSSVIPLKDWATKELLDFVAHMKNGDTSVLSQFDVQELMLEYIKRNNLRDPRKKSQIVCDSRLKILFGKPRVGHFEMLKLLEFHFFINEDPPKNKIKSIAKQVDPDWNIDNTVTAGKEKKKRNHKKTEERAPQNEINEYAAIDIHNMNLVYLRRKFMENLIGDGENFQRKVVGSIVRIRISGTDKKHDMYRLVQVVGTSKADAPYKVGSKSADVVLEVLNLDKKETVSIATISNQDLSEDECRRLRQSIKCGLVKRFTVGEIQDKAVSLQSVRLNDLMEAETLRLNNLRDRASEKGHKKRYPLMTMIDNLFIEYVEKLQLLKTPEERERRLREIPEVHSDPKMNPDYESDDTEEYFNKENGDHKKSKYSGISRENTSSTKEGKDFSKNVNSRSMKNEEGLTSTKAAGRINMKKDAHGPSSSGRPQSQVDYNRSTVTDRNHNSVSETSTSSYSMKNTPTSNNNELDKIWHYRDPSGKIQGPFCMVQLQKWSTTGYFPQDMRIWTNREDDSLLLNDVLKQQLNIKTATDKVGSRIEGLTVRTTNLSTQKAVNHEKLPGTHGSTGLSAVQNWIANGTTNTLSFGKSNESNTTDLASPTPAGNAKGTNNVSSVFDIANADLMDLPSPTPKETTATHVVEKVQIVVDKEAHVVEKVQNVVDKEAGNVGGAHLPETAEEWAGYSPTDRAATTSANVEQAIPSSPQPSSQPGYNSLPAWQGVRETIEFSTLAEESVSDLLAEVDAMESQNGFPSPTSRRNNFVEDLFSGSFEDFSPTPNIQASGSRSDTFSSNGAEIHFPFQPTTATTTTTTTIAGTSQGNNNNVFDFVKSSTDLELKWPEMPRETISKDTSDVNTSTKADEPERETNSSETSHDRAGGSNEHNKGECNEPTTTKLKDPSPELVIQSRTDHKEAGDECAEPTTTKLKDSSPELVRTDHKEPGDGTVQPAMVDTVEPPPPPQPPQSLPQPLAVGLAKVHPQGGGNNFGRPAQEIMTQVAPHLNMSRGVTIGWDPHQQNYGGERFDINNPRERSYRVEDSGYSRNGKPWVRQSSFGSGGNGGGGYSRTPPKGQRICKFYETGRCKKGASCNYLHP